MIQGYFVFFVFIGIMLVLQVYLIPELGEISGSVLAGLGGGIKGLAGEHAVKPSVLNFNFIFSSLILVQGFFAGLLVGKFAEGELKVGLKHSLILMVVGYILFTTIAGV
jgi:flagellar protein FlaJ